MQKIFTLTLFIALCITKTTDSFAQNSTTDSLALVSLYNSTNGSLWLNHTNWLTSKPINQWTGITTNGFNVIMISLDGNNLNGTIPSAIGNLSQLGTLILSDNELTGEIPVSIGNLSGLGALNLDNNQLNDTIPASIGNLSGLGFLDLSGNLLIKNIPSSIGNLSGLGTLYLYQNQLSGTIPSAVGNLTNLFDLELNNNNLSGSIPASFDNLTSLNTLSLNDNQLSGSLPNLLGDLTQLNALNLYNNGFTGTIPSVLSNLTSLQTLNLDSNQLSGTIPSFLGTLPSLSGLGLNDNQFSGTIPSSLGNSNFFFLDISFNQLSGTVPSSFGNLSNSTTSINNNDLTFDGLEQVVTSLSASILIDSPQAIIPLHLSGSLLSVSAGGTLANDTFHWYKNGVLDTTIVGDSTFDAIISAHYSVAVTNRIVTSATGGLILYSDTLMAGTVLPVTWLNFTGSLVDNSTWLQWQTANEINTSYFNVQRSTDGSNFTTIGKVNATTNIQSANYQYTDVSSSLLSNQFHIIFYRLQEVNKDGSISYSNIIKVLLNNDGSFVIYPNPATDVLNIITGTNNGNALLDIFDINGRKLIEQQQNILPGNNININISSLSKGMYLIRMNVDGAVMEQKFMKQ